MNVRVLILAIFLNITQFTTTYHVLIDLNGVLLKTSKMKGFSRLGVEVLGNPHLKERLFEFMNYIDEDPDATNFYMQGTKLPTFLCEWQRGNMTCEEMTNFIIQKADENPDFFSSDTEQRLIKKIATFFLPKQNIEINNHSPSMIQFVKECKKNGHLVYLASNFDKETFVLVKQNFPEIIELFDKDKLIISGDIGLIKPEAGYYDYILEKFGLNADECCLIDDTPENVDGAKKCGIHGIVYKNTRQTRRDFKQLVRDKFKFEKKVECHKNSHQKKIKGNSLVKVRNPKVLC